MLNHNLLINKGFKLNSYAEDKFYELVINNKKQMEEISNIINIPFDYENRFDDEIDIQMKEDFSNKIICIEGDIWDLADEELQQILKCLN